MIPVDTWPSGRGGTCGTQTASVSVDRVRHPWNRHLRPTRLSLPSHALGFTNPSSLYLTYLADCGRQTLGGGRVLGESPSLATHLWPPVTLFQDRTRELVARAPCPVRGTQPSPLASTCHP